MNTANDFGLAELIVEPDFLVAPGDMDTLRAVHRYLGERNRENLNLARATGRKHFTMYRSEHVYVHPETGEHVPACEAPREAFSEDWKLAGFRVAESRRSLSHQDRLMRDGRRCLVNRMHARRDPGPGIHPHVGERESRDCTAHRSRTGSITRAASRGGDSGDGDGEPDPPGERTPPAGRETAERPTRPCPDGSKCGGVGTIVKPGRGPWPKRCPECKRAHDAKRKARERSCTRIDPETGVARGHSHPVGPCTRCGAYVRPPLSEAKRNLLKTAMEPAEAPIRDDTSRKRTTSWYEPYEPEGRPLRVRPTTPTTIDQRRPDWRLVYVRKYLRGELTAEGAKRIIASIERDREAERESREPITHFIAESPEPVEDVEDVIRILDDLDSDAFGAVAA